MGHLHITAALALLFPFFSIAVADYTPNTGIPIRVDNAKYPRAVCIDGTPATYYIRKSTSAVNATKWVLHLEGGGWCWDDATCSDRRNSFLGTTINDTVPADLNILRLCNGAGTCGALSINNQSYNPMTYDWNFVFLRYCDGGSFSGSLDEVVNTYPGQPMYFRGHDNLEAIMGSLLENEGLGDATDVFYGGASAGGLATYLHIDYLADTIKAASPNAKVLGMPDSGYWPESCQYSGGTQAIFPQVVTYMNVTETNINANCMAKFNNLTHCMFPQNFANLIDTPLFVVQSLFDPLQKDCGPEPDTSRDGHAAWLLETIQETVLSKPQNGGFVYSCERHCGGQLLYIDGVQVPEALPVFLSSESAQRLWLQNNSYPCEDCCNNGGGLGPKPPPTPVSLLQF